MSFINSCAYDFIDLDGDSDENRAESSEDDIDIILHGTPKQRRQLRRLSEGRNDSSSEDEFEKEMDKELQKTVDNLESQRETSEKSNEEKTVNQGASTSSTKESSSSQFYDNIYFDSDEEEGSNAGSHRKHPVISNDDLLYDPNMDDDDQKWVDKQREQCRPQTNTSESTRKGKVKPLPSSDAVLDCPACMTTLCMDCQRHSTYSNQYRAMFVMNCVVDSSEILKYPKEIGKKQKKKNRNRQRSSENGITTEVTDDDKYNPVKCSECGTVVAMYDQDEIYHFFNILASHS